MAAIKALLGPAVWWMNRLGYRGKFLWQGLFVATALLLLVITYSRHVRENVDALQDERAGLALIRQATTLIQNLQQHRGRSASVLGGNRAMEPARLAKSQDVGAGMRALAASLPARLQGHPEFADITAGWDRIARQGMAWPVHDNFQAHNQLIESLLNFLVTMGDHYHLVLDSDIGSYYLIDLSINKIPALTERMGKLRAYGSAIISSHTMSAERRFELISLLAELRTIHDQAQRNLLHTQLASPQHKATLDVASRVFSASQADIGALVHQHILSDHFDIGPEAYFKAATTDIDAVFSILLDSLYPAIHAGLNARIEAAQRQWNTTLLALATLLGAVLYLAAGGYVAVLGGVGELLSATQALKGGDLARRTHLQSRDELAQIGQGINDMAASIQALISEQEANQRALTAQAERLQLAGRVFDEAHEGISITDTQGVILDVNPMFCAQTGYSREELIGQSHRLIKSYRNESSFYADLWNGVLAHGHWQGELWNRRKDGHEYAVQLTISALRNERDEPRNYVALCSDITELKLQFEKMEHLAHHDKLTGLPNRALLADRLLQALNRAHREREIVGVVGVDLDGFKAVNDTFGHEAGDILLIEISRRLEQTLRAGDTVARLGGDEFVLLLANAGTQEDCERVLQRVLHAINRPISVAEGQTAHVSGSLGYTLFPDDDTDADGLLRHADVAMYEAKQSGKNRFCRFDTQLDRRQRANSNVLERLEHGLRDGEFTLFIQPKFNLLAGTLVGAEALLRWRHPIRGLMAPAQFIPVIEQNRSLALHFDAWVLQQSLRWMSTWKQQGLRLPLSINISAHQLMQREFPEQLNAALDACADLPAQDLEIEILESAALDDVPHVAAMIRACQQRGVRFALDDFGTGYSTLTYLKQLGVNTLKIDQSFIWDMESDNSSSAIVQGVIGLASAFGCHLVAEGVQTREQAHRLMDMGCPVIQGYVVAKPMPPEDVLAWVAQFDARAFAQALRRKESI